MGNKNGLGLLQNLTQLKAIEDRTARISDIFLTNSYQMKPLLRHRTKERAKLEYKRKKKERAK